MIERLRVARSFLFVPGNRPERFAKAVASGADAVILDLEDSVPGAEKAVARRSIAEAVARLGGDVPVLVRTNARDSDCWSEDVTLVRDLAGVAAVVVPKAEAVEALAVVGHPVIALIESAQGVARMGEVAAAPRVLRLALGHLDFLADTGMIADADETQVGPLRFAMTVLSRTHRLAPPVDGVTTAIDDAEQLARDVARARSFGFGGKLCIHPRQVAGVHAAFAPTPEELAWARRVVAGDEQAGGAAFQLDGRMVDAPVVAMARQVLARAVER